MPDVMAHTPPAEPAEPKSAEPAATAPNFRARKPAAKKVRVPSFPPTPASLRAARRRPRSS